MNSTKKSILDQIAARVQRKKDLEQKIAERQSNVENFIIELLKELDEDVCSTVNTSLFQLPEFRQYYAGSIEERIKTLDSKVKIEVSWHDTADGEMPRVNGILIKWSKKYQKNNSCDEQLFIDVASLLFR